MLFRSWGINFHSMDTQASSAGRGNEIKSYPSGDDMVYAYDWTDTGDPWAVEVGVNPDAEPPNIDEQMEDLENDRIISDARIKVLLELRKQLNELKDKGD